MLDCQKQAENKNPERNTERRLETMQKDLHLTQAPVHIECFDNSNLQGTNPVASCVVFINTKPAKKLYRHYHIKTVVGPNDFASMSEIIFRRYSRALKENAELPQLIIVDGGKGQLHAAVESLKKLDLYGKIAIIGIAKRLEEIYFPYDSIPLYIDKNSETLKVIQQARDEAHRFGIKFHRNQRSNKFLRSQLTEIDGIGEKTAILLINKFKSIENIKEANLGELAAVVGEKRARIITENLKYENDIKNETVS
jgi:excinuclease ABC subunit C